jgi:nitrite transporter NirC
MNIGYDQLDGVCAKKLHLFKNNKTGYMVSSVLAGMYVGMCVITINVMAGLLGNFAGLKIIQAFSFAAALSLVVFAGAELFTGNIFVMTAGFLRKKIIMGDALGLCAFCYVGNFVGSVLIAALFLGTGYLQGPLLEQTIISIDIKTDPYFMQLLIRGVLCNILVCVAAWCSYRMTSESGKLIMIFWCIFLFVLCGYEHSIANMTLFSLGTMSDGFGTVVPMLVNLLSTTTGNIIGGVVLSVAYWSVSIGAKKS